MRNEKSKPMPLKLQEKKVSDDRSILPEDDADFDNYSENAYKKSVIVGSIGPCQSVIYNSKLQVNWEDLKTGLEIEIQEAKIPSRVIRAFAFEQSFTKEDSEVVYENYKKFLLLKALVVESVKVAPSSLIMRAWALHAAESRSYIKFCRKMFGKVLGPSDSSIEQSHYKTTVSLFEYVFSTPRDEMIWPEKQDEPPCHVIYDVVGIINQAMMDKQDAISYQSSKDKFEQELIKEAIAPMADNQI